MASFEDTFRLRTESESFANLFEAKLQKVVGHAENLSISSKKSGNFWIVEVVGEPFGGSSQYEAESMANALMACLSTESAVSFEASYELDDYRGGDQASVRFVFPNSNNNFEMAGDFGEYDDGDVDDEDDDYDDYDESACTVLIEYAKRGANWKKVNNTITRVEGAWD